ncbi:MAG: DUF2993 domain-containing protein [bacterium]|nr:DUF2993 domain-containing protein [bacterium]
MFRGRRALLLLLAAVAIMLAGCTNINETVAAKLKQALQEKVGKAARYDVKLETSPQYKLAQGKVDKLTVTGNKVDIGGDLIADYVCIDINDIRYNITGRKLSSVGKSYIRMDIDENALSTFARRERKDLPGLEINLDKDLVTLTMLRNGDRQSVIGKLDVDRENRLVLVPNKSYGDDASIRRLLDGVNPILDLSKFAFPMNITDIDISKGSLRLKATAKPPASLFK